MIDGSRSAGARVGERVTSLNTSHLTYLKTIPGESSTSDYLQSVRSLLSLVLSNILEGLEGVIDFSIYNGPELGPSQGSG